MTNENTRPEGSRAGANNAITAFERIEQALMVATGPGKMAGRSWSFRCPAHSDREPSLSVTPIDGMVLMYCHAGCPIDDVLTALRLTKSDLYDDRKGATYRYDSGRIVHRTPDKKFYQSGDLTKVDLFHLARLLEAGPGEIFLVEGEKDVLAIEAAGGVATTAPMGSNNFTKADITPLAGRYITAIVDKDAAGVKWANDVEAALVGRVAGLRFAEAALGKDAADHIASGCGLEEFVEFYRVSDAPINDDCESGDEPVEEPLFIDVAAILANGIPPAPEPVLLHREDGHALFYSGKVNVLFGDPECGKTWIALAAAVEALDSGRRVAIIDLDHNGADELLTRLLILGAKPATLSDPNVFRLSEPDDGEHLAQIIHALREWRPAVAVIDSVGELLPLLGLSSNSPDDYTIAHRRTLTSLSNAGAAVIVIDHLPKSDDARSRGQTGTMAKRRAVNGVSLRVTLAESFAPGRGGAASMVVEKDRPGGVRAYCPAGKNQPAGRFVMTTYGDGTTSWKVTAPAIVDPRSASDRDVAELDALDPPPRSQRDVQKRLKWGAPRAMTALQTWRDLRKDESEEYDS